MYSSQRTSEYFSLEWNVKYLSLESNFKYRAKIYAIYMVRRGHENTSCPKFSHVPASEVLARIFFSSLRIGTKETHEILHCV